MSGDSGREPSRAMDSGTSPDGGLSLDGGDTAAPSVNCYREGQRVLKENPGSLNDALSSVRAGETLELSEGRYTISGTLTLTQAGSDEQPICVVAASGADVLIAAGSAIRFTTASHWVFDGLEFRSRALRFEGSDPGHDFHTTIRGGEFSGFGLVVTNGQHISIRGNHFHDIRSGQHGVDRHAVTLIGKTSDIDFSNNTCEDVSADCLQSQGNHEISDVLVHNNVMRIKRPRPASDPFCNTGENGLDIKVGADWVITNNTFEGFQRFATCENFESTSDAGEGIVIHKKGARRFVIRGNTFRNNTEHVKIVGKTCSSSGTDCSGSLYSQDIEISGNTFDSSDVNHATWAIFVAPGIAANSAEIGAARFKIPSGIEIRGNVFRGHRTDIQVRKTSTFATANPAGEAVPFGTIVQDNTLADDARIVFDADVPCAGNQCP